ncbi:hypothetical protein CLORY_33390 [Clostridium oryzae]|uniref:Uncharacterized protein n=1 Tax=Clostridium oryzae TaxID=1450648 RepID=A0A1V4IHJ8_9CLOT|nr:hypothetical protein CLORY_33390 [Clostridium oryzae]
MVEELFTLRMEGLLSNMRKNKLILIMLSVAAVVYLGDVHLETARIKKS